MKLKSMAIVSLLALFACNDQTHHKIYNIGDKSAYQNDDGAWMWLIAGQWTQGAAPTASQLSSATEDEETVATGSSSPPMTAATTEDEETQPTASVSEDEESSSASTSVSADEDE